MYERFDQLDDQLAGLAATVRGGDVVTAGTQLAELAHRLDRAMRREERELELLERRQPEITSPLGKVRREHGSLRGLVSAIAGALEASDGPRGVELIGKLRSVLLLHLAKEQGLAALLSSRAF